MTTDEQLVENLMRYKNDPLGAVKYAFPWGDKKTILAEHSGPDKWQTEFLNEVGDYCKSGKQDAFQSAVASGKGIGKGTTVAWLVWWFMSTRTFPQIVVTANTKAQLETKTWRELAKWHKLAINSHWFKWTATKYYVIGEDTWFAAAIPWSKEKPDAFQGTHDENVLIIFDEASGIPDTIWEAAGGSMSTPHSMWMVFGNPLHNTGMFRECFGRNRHRWITKQVDSRTAKMTNKSEIQKDIDDYGEDSDFVRRKWLGIFPRTSSTQFIGNESVEIAMKRDYKPSEYNFSPITIGVDVAREGDDQSVILVRQGLKIHDIKRFRNVETQDLASHVAATEDEYKRLSNIIITYVDVGNAGSGVIDRLRKINRAPIEINFGKNAINKRKYFNKRVEMWGLMRDWIEEGGQLPDDKELYHDLIGPEYGFSGIEQLQLERKKDMKSRGLASPDSGDALALTFAFPVYETVASLGYGDGYNENWHEPVQSTSITGY